MSVELATEVTDALAELFTHALTIAANHRGGPAMLQSILADEEPRDFLEGVIARNELWTARAGENIIGFALCRNGLIEAVYVQKSSRRQGVGTSLVRAAQDVLPEPVDAYALPGDRATKSLYESLGWKARLLTMRGV